MSSLISRGSILLFSRFSNIILQLVSPIFLVRILDMYSYGQYQAFNLYALLLTNLCAFGISSNLLYFLRKYPEKLKVLVSHTAALLFCVSLIGTLAIAALKNVAFTKSTVDISIPLIVFVFFSLNMAFWDTFWLAAKKALYVLYYSTTIMVVRIVGLLIVAVLFKNVMYIIAWLCIVQIGRFLFVLINAIKRKWFTFAYEKDLIKEQTAYFVPLGLANAIRYLNNSLSQLFVAQALGVEALAIYTLGSRYLPVVTLARSTIVDTVLPDIVERGLKNEMSAFHLWQKANVLLTGAILPCFVVGTFYANEIITTLFTADYSDAVPIFRIYLFLMVVQALELTLPIRNKNKNSHIIYAGALRLVSNIFLIMILSRSLGIVGPAIAAVVSGIIECSYLGYAVYRLYPIDLSGLLMWKKEIKIAVTSFGGLIFLKLVEIAFGSSMIVAITGTACFFGFYSLLMWKLNVEEFKIVIIWCVRKIRLSLEKLHKAR